MGMSLGSFASRSVATRVVATDGTGDFTDIQSAIDDLPSTGGVVYIKEGTYTVTTNLSINSSNDVALIGAGRATVVKTTTDIIVLLVESSDGVYLSQINFKGTGVSAHANPVVKIRLSNDCIVSGCWITDAGDTGLLLDGGARITIIGNQCTSNDESGIQVAGPDECIVIGNVCSSNSGDGILVADSNNTIINGNSCKSNTESGIELGGSASGNIVTSNVCLGNTVAQITDGGSSTQLGHNVTS